MNPMDVLLWVLVLCLCVALMAVVAEMLVSLYHCLRGDD